MPVTVSSMDFFRAQLYVSDETELLTQTQLWLPLREIVEIVTVQRQEICPLPGVAVGVMGVINLRGQLIWVVDLRGIGQGMLLRRLNPQEKLTVILVHHPQGQGQVGCLVARLQGIVSVDATTLEPLGEDWAGVYPCCDRQGRWENQQGFILNVGQLFTYLQQGQGLTR